MAMHYLIAANMIQYKATEKGAEYLGYLDAARSIAAIMVAISHFVNWKYSDATWAKLLTLVFNGAAAVSFFFVLSGFVLSYKYVVLKHPLDIGKFYLNRIFRIWPAFFLTVLLNALYLYRNDLNAGYLINQFIYNQSNFWNEALLLRAHPKFYIPGWTLDIELAMSFMVPFFIVIGLKHTRLLLWLLLATLLLCGNMGDWYMFYLNFILGVLVSFCYNYITDNEFKLSKWYKNRSLLILVAIILCWIKDINGFFPFPKVYFSVARWIGLIDFFPFSAAGSFIFLVFIIWSTAVKKALQHIIFRRLGKLSFSIYLMHWLPMVIVYDHWKYIKTYFPNTTIMFITMLVCVMALTMVMAYIIYKLAVLPSIRLGKSITSDMKGTFVIDSDKQ